MTVVRYDAIEQELRIKISKRILPYFISLRENYTLFELDIALSLKSKYAKRLYEMLSQHRRAGSFSISVEELKWRLKLIDKKKGTEQYSDFSLLRTRILDVAQEELAKHADICFTYTPTKTGKKYTHLEFRIHDNQKPEEATGT